MRLPARISSTVALVLVTLLALLVTYGIAPPSGALAEQDAGAASIWVTRAEGIINPPLAGHLVDTMEKAADAGAAALVIEMDTPGGLDTSMRDIIQAEIDCAIPVIVYVYPQGARAASAGVYILMGADVAAMAPQTNLGAATPVSLTGEMDEVMQAKVTNDAAAYIRGLAETHGRNADWAEQAVREAVSLPADDALEQNVVEFVAADLPALVEAVDGYVVTPKGLTLQTAGAAVEEVGMSWVKRFLQAVANPDVAYILMTLGVLGLIFELSAPGIGVAGVAGVISLILAFYSFQVLPVNWAGLALIILAVILFVAEIFVQSHGILGVGGAVAIILGGFLLFDTSAPFLRVSRPVVIGVGVVAFAFLVLVVGKVARARRRPPSMGLHTFVGNMAVVVSPLSPEGQVRLHGEIWRARSEETDLLKDEPVEVIGSEGMTLIVRRPDESDDLTKPGAWRDAERDATRDAEAGAERDAEAGAERDAKPDETVTGPESDRP